MSDENKTLDERVKFVGESLTLAAAELAAAAMIASDSATVVTAHIEDYRKLRRALAVRVNLNDPHVRELFDLVERVLDMSASQSKLLTKVGTILEGQCDKTLENAETLANYTVNIPALGAENNNIH